MLLFIALIVVVDFLKLYFIHVIAACECVECGVCGVCECAFGCAFYIYWPKELIQTFLERQKQTNKQIKQNKYRNKTKQNGIEKTSHYVTVTIVRLFYPKEHAQG